MMTFEQTLGRGEYSGTHVIFFSPRERVREDEGAGVKTLRCKGALCEVVRWLLRLREMSRVKRKDGVWCRSRRAGSWELKRLK